MADASTMRIFAVANQKGGVGKTTTTTSLGAAWPNGISGSSSSTWIPKGMPRPGSGLMVASSRRSVYDVLLNDVPMVDIVEPTGLQQPLRRARNA